MRKKQKEKKARDEKSQNKKLLVIINSDL